MSVDSVSLTLNLPTNNVEAACWRVAIRTATVLVALRKPVSYFTPAQLGRIAAAVNERQPVDLEEAMNPDGFQFAIARMYPDAPGPGQRVIPSMWLILGIHAAFDGGRTDLLEVNPTELTKGLARKVESLPEWFNVTSAMMDAANIIESFTDSTPMDVFKFLADGWLDRHSDPDLRWLEGYTSSTAVNSGGLN